MEACNALLLRDPRPAGRGRRFHHRARNQPDVRRDGRRRAGRLLGARGVAGRRRLCRAWARAAGRSPPMRCGCCAQAGFAGEVHFVETSPVLRDVQAKLCPTREWHDDSIDHSRRPAAAARRQRILRRACRSANSSAANERRVVVDGGRPGVRPRRRDRRGFAGARRSRRGRSARQLDGHGGVALIIDYGHAQSAPGDTLQAVRGHRFADRARRSRRAGPHRPRRFRGRRASAASVGASSDAGRRPGRVARAARHRRARRRARQGQSGARRRDRSGARAAVRAGADGRAVQGDGDPRARLAGAGGVRP